MAEARTLARLGAIASWPREELDEALADAYYAAARAGADMRRAADELERLRDALREAADPFRAWSDLDDAVGRAFDRPEQAPLVELRAAFVGRFTSALVANVREAAAHGTGAAWGEALAACAVATAAWRLEILRALLDEGVGGDAAFERERTAAREQARAAWEERWSEAMDWFGRMADQPGLAAGERVKLVVAQAQIEMFHFERLGRARELLARAAEIAPEEPTLLVTRGDLALRDPRLESDERGREADALYRRALALDARCAEASWALGDVCRDKRDARGAVDWYRDAIERRPGVTGGYLRLLHLHALGSDAPPSLEPIERLVARAVAVDPCGAYGTYLEAATALHRLGRRDEAAAWLRRAVELDPGRLVAPIREANLLIDETRYAEARAAFQRVVERAPDWHEPHFGLARVAMLEEAWPEARSHLEDSARCRPELAHTMRAYVAQTLLRDGEAGHALTEALVALKLDGEGEFSLQIAEEAADAVAARDESDLEPLLRQIRGVVGPEYDRRLATVLVRWLRAKRLWERGEDYWRDAGEAVRGRKDPRVEMALFLNARANSLYERGDYAAAVPFYERSVELDPDDAVLHSNLARALENHAVDGGSAARLERAQAALTAAIRLDSHNAEYGERLEAVRALGAGLERFGFEALERTPVVTPIAIEVASDLVPLVEGAEGALAEAAARGVEDLRAGVKRDFGVPLPGLRFRGNEADLPDGSYIVSWMNVPLVLGFTRRGRTAVLAPVAALEARGIRGEPATDPLSGAAAVWVEASDAERAAALGHATVEPFEWMVRHLRAVIERNLASLVGVQEASSMLGSPRFDRATDGGADGIARVLRALLAERAPIVALPAIFERYLALVRERRDRTAIVEELRSLPEVVRGLPGADASYRRVQLSEDAEARLRAAVHRDGSAPSLALEPRACQELLAEVRELAGGGRCALVVRDAELRPLVRKLVELEWPDLHVLSRAEAAEHDAVASGAAPERVAMEAAR